MSKPAKAFKCHTVGEAKNKNSPDGKFSDRELLNFNLFTSKKIRIPNGLRTDCCTWFNLRTVKNYGSAQAEKLIADFYEDHPEAAAPKDYEAANEWKSTKRKSNIRKISAKKWFTTS